MPNITNDYGSNVPNYEPIPSNVTPQGQPKVSFNTPQQPTSQDVNQLSPFNPQREVPQTDIEDHPLSPAQKEMNERITASVAEYVKQNPNATPDEYREAVRNIIYSEMTGRRTQP